MTDMGQGESGDPALSSSTTPVSPASVVNQAAPVEPTITGVFMQDYALGGPVTDSQRLEVLYTAKDGTLNVYSPVFFGQLERLPSIDRIYASPASQTGWARDRIVLPPEPSKGNPVLMPTAVLTAETNTILLFRQFCIQGMNLGPDGAIDPNIAMIHKPPSIPMTSGVQPQGTAYIPEMLVDLSGSVPQVVLREVMGLKTYPVDWTGIPVTKGWASGARRQIFALKQQSPKSYAFVALEESGDVAYVRLEMAPSGDRFNTSTHLKLGSSRSSCVHVREDTPGTVEILILDFPAVTSITGTYSSGSDLQVQPQSSLPRSIPEFPPSRDGTQYHVTGATNPASGSTELYIQLIKPGLDVTSEDLWLTTRRLTGEQADVWEPPVLLDRGSRFISFAPTDVQTFATFRDSTGLEVWQSTEAGTFEQERAFLEVDGPVADTQVYRAGIELGVNAAPVAGAVVTISTSETCVAIVDGRRRVLGPKRPVQVLSNEQGTAWVSLAVEDSLYIPSIFISSPVLAHDLVLEPNDKIQEFLGSLQSDKLRAAKDPRTQQAVLPNPGNADSVSDAIRRLMAVTPKEKASAIAGAPRLTSNVRAAWAEQGTIPKPKAVTQTAPSSFRLSKSADGIVTLENLTSAQAEQHLAQMAILPVVPMDSFTDWWEDRWNDVKGGFEDFFDIIIDGAKVALQVVIDGVTYAYNFVMDTVGAVFDAINMVLDYAGVLLGTALGWLLELLGFLFDWPAIKRRRDRLREVIYQQARAVPTFIGDPQIALTSFSDQLQSARDALTETLSSFKSSQAASTPFGSFLSDVPPLGAILSPGFGSIENSVLPQVTWLMDKVMAVFPATRFTPAMPAIPDFDSLLGGLVSAVLATGDKFAGTLQDLSSLGLRWISDPRLFTASTFDPVFEVLIRRLIDFLDVLKDIFNAIAKLLSAMWSNFDKIIDWFDQPLPKSFFSGFYRGLTGRSLSAFDLACLGAAFVDTYDESSGDSGSSALRLTANAALSAPDQELKQHATALMAASCVITAINAGWTASLSDTSENYAKYSRAGDVLTVLDAALTQSASLVRRSERGQDAAFWISTSLTAIVILPLAISAGGIWVLGKFLPLGPDKFKGLIATYQGTMALVQLFTMILDIPSADLDLILEDNFAFVQHMGAAIVRTIRPLEPIPLAGIGYGAAQGSLSAIRTILQAQEPFSPPH